MTPPAGDPRSGGETEAQHPLSHRNADHRPEAGAEGAEVAGEPARRRYLWALAVLLVTLVGVAWVAGHQSMRGAPAGAKSLDAERLGPEAGQPVAEYLAALPARLPAPGMPPVPALVQFTAGLDAPAAAALIAAGPAPGTTGPAPVTAVLRVPLPRVQTALRFQPLAPVTDPDPVAALRRRLALAQAAAQRVATTDAARLTGRRAQVAAAEAAALGAPGCRCVLAVLVRADRAGLDGLAARPGIRAVDAAPEGTPDDGVALAPLLPEQAAVAGPVPDDGPVLPG
jgi:hypothetical protein